MAPTPLPPRSRTAPGRAVDDRQRRPPVGHRRSPPTPASSWSVATPGAPTRSGATSASSAGSSPLGVTRDQRRRRPPRAATRTASCYNPKWPDVDEMVRILEAGINIVTHRRVHHRPLARRGARPPHRGVRAGRRLALRQRHQPRVRQHARHRLRRASATGSTRSRCSSRPTPPGTTPPRPSSRSGSAVRSTTPRSRHGRATAPRCSRTRCGWSPTRSGVELDDVRCEAEFAAAPEDVVMTSWTIDQGCVAGVSASWQGWVDGRKVIDLQVRWRKGPSLEPNWEVGGGLLRGDRGPAVRCGRTIEILPPPDFVAKTFDDFMVLGMIMTAMPAIDAIPAVCAAAPGIVTYLDLPLITPRGFVPRRADPPLRGCRAALRPAHYPASVRQQTLRFGDGWARIAPWRGGGGAAHLVVSPDATVSPSVVQRCVEKARASGLRLGAHERGRARRVRARSSTPASRCRNGSTCSRSTSTPARDPPSLPLREGDPARPARRARARRPLVRRVLAARPGRAQGRPRRDAHEPVPRRCTTTTAWSRTRSPASPAGSATCSASRCTPTCGRRGWGHALVADAPALDLAPRRRPRLREHPVGRTTARSRSTSRSGSRSSPPACASSAARCDGPRPFAPGARRAGSRPSPASSASRTTVAVPHRPARRPRADVRARAAEPVGRARRRLRRCASGAADVPADARGGGHRARPAAVAHRVRRQRRRRQPPADARPPAPFPFDELPVDAADRSAVLVVPDRARSATTACSRSRSTCGPRPTNRSRTSSPTWSSLRSAPTARSPSACRCNVAWVWPLQAEPAYVGGPVPINPTTLADLAPTGRLGRQADAAGRQHRRAADARAQPRDARGVGRPRRRSRPSSPRAPSAIRAADQSAATRCSPGRSCPSTCRRSQRGGLGGRREAPSSTAACRALEQFFGAHVDPSTALPGPLDAARCRARCRARACASSCVDGDALMPVHEKYTPAHPYKMQTVDGDDSTAVTVVATDAGLEQFLSGDEPPRCAPRTSSPGSPLVAGEQPSIDARRRDREPRRSGTPTTRSSPHVLAGLRGNPLLAPTTVEGLLAGGAGRDRRRQPDGARCYRQLAPYVAAARRRSPPRSTQQGVRTATRSRSWSKSPTTRARRDADRGVGDVVGGGVGQPRGSDRRRGAARLDRRARSTAYLDQIEVQPHEHHHHHVEQGRDPDQLPEQQRPTTITVHAPARERPAAVPRGRRTRRVTLPPQRNTTVRVAVETRGSGTAPVHMTVTADGLPSSRRRPTIKVRSTFVSGVGVFLTVGAIVFLVLWWGWDIHRRRKKRGRETHHPSFPIWRRPPDSPRERSGGEREPDDGVRPLRTHDDRFDDPGLVEPGSNPTESETSLVRSSALVAVGTALSRVTGFVRIAAIAYALGASTLAGTYSYANEAPNIVYELLLGGVLTATLVPLFVQLPRARATTTRASAIFTVAIVALAGITVGRHRRGAVDRRPLHAQRQRAEPRRAAGAGHRAAAAAHAADALLRHRRARHRDAQRAPPLPRRRVRAGAQQRGRGRGVPDAPRVSPTGRSPSSSVLDDDALILLIGLGTTAGVVAMALALLPAAGAPRTPTCGSCPAGAIPRCSRCCASRAGRSATSIANQIALLVVTVLANGTDGGPFIYISAYAFFQLPHGLFAVSLMTTFTPEMATRGGAQRPRGAAEPAVAGHPPRRARGRARGARCTSRWRARSSSPCCSAASFDAADASAVSRHAASRSRSVCSRSPPICSRCVPFYALPRHVHAVLAELHRERGEHRARRSRCTCGSASPGSRSPSRSRTSSAPSSRSGCCAGGWAASTARELASSLARIVAAGRRGVRRELGDRRARSGGRASARRCWRSSPGPRSAGPSTSGCWSSSGSRSCRHSRRSCPPGCVPAREACNDHA